MCGNFESVNTCALFFLNLLREYFKPLWDAITYPFVFYMQKIY